MGTLRFVIIAVVLMIFADYYIFGGTRSYIEDAKTQNVAEVKPSEVRAPEFVMPPHRVEPPAGQDFFESLPMEEPYADIPPDTQDPIHSFETTPPKREGKAKIAIIIDDIGMDVRRSKAAIHLPAPITMALLPYAPRVKEMAQEAKRKGHTLIIHTPMEAMDGTVNIGPGGLKESMGEDGIKKSLHAMMESFDGYEGINNHMGSKLTQDKDVMQVVMNELKDRNLFFVDSKTSPQSVAESMAAQAGLAHAGRDVFLDHVESIEFVRNALKKTENMALSRGYAIAIGHPKDFTIQGLKEWMPTLAEKGIELVSVKELLSHTKAKDKIEDRQESPGKKTVLHPVSISEEKAMVESNVPVVEDVFFDDVNKAFAPAKAEPEITLHPLPQQ